MKQTLICITGGHITPALAVIEELQRTHADWALMVIGRRHIFEGESAVSQEEQLVRALGVSFYALTTGRLQRAWTGASVLSLAKIPVGFVTALFTLMRTRPSVILSFGGYIALPVALAGAILHIPVVTHEQTAGLGFANSLIARLAQRVLLARETGVPLRRRLLDSARPRKPSYMGVSSLPIIYITGGSTGALTLNSLIYPLLPILCQSYVIIHQAGERNKDISLNARHSLPPEIRKNYIVTGYTDVDALSWIYRHALLVIGRSGANTVAEVSALGVPALCIPLPWSAGGEQKKNAQLLADAGMAVVLDQQTISQNMLLTQITAMIHDIKRFQHAAAIVSARYPRDGAANVVKEVEESLTNFPHS